MNANEKIREAYEELTSAENAVAGCGMFAPEPMKSRDLPRLIEAMQEKSIALGEALEEAGVI